MAMLLNTLHTLYLISSCIKPFCIKMYLLLPRDLSRKRVFELLMQKVEKNVPN